MGWTLEGAAAWDARLRAPAGAEGVAARLRRGGVPARLADALCAEAGLAPDARMAGLRREHRQALVQALADYRLAVTGHEVLCVLRPTQSPVWAGADSQKQVCWSLFCWALPAWPFNPKQESIMCLHFNSPSHWPLSSTLVCASPDHKGGMLTVQPDQ